MCLSVFERIFICVMHFLITFIIDVYSECYQSNESRSFKLLIRQSPVWGGATCLQMATAAEARLFFSHDGVQVSASHATLHLLCLYVQVSVLPRFSGVIVLHLFYRLCCQRFGGGTLTAIQRCGNWSSRFFCLPSSTPNSSVSSQYCGMKVSFSFWYSFQSFNAVRSLREQEMNEMPDDFNQGKELDSADGAELLLADPSNT